MANTTNYNWETPDDTDLVKDGAAAIRTLGSSIDTTTKALNPSTTLGDIEYRSATANTNTRLAIGTTGQVLTVAGGVPTWATSDDANAIQNAIVDAKGDIIAASAADTPARLAVGANGTVLTADSAEATGLKWATPAGGGGKVLQVVSALTSTSTTISSSTYADSTITATITPTSATSKVLVIVSAHATATKTASGVNLAAKMRLMRDSTNVWEAERAFFLEHSTSSTDLGYAYSAGITYLDSPATTSAITYKIQGAYVVGNAIIFQNAGISDSTITLLEIGA
jgi:hypothetical protein